MITGVVLARNEEANIVDCLQSLRPFVGELLLIDMESSDRTVQLARPLVEQVLSHPLVGNFDAARNVAIPAAKFDWLWFIDADERVPTRTGELVIRLLSEEGANWDAISIPFRTYFCGQWMQHCGWWPGYTMPRIMKRGKFHFSERLHGGVELQGPELRFPPDPALAIEHFSYRDISHYVEKLNRYTSTEAQQFHSEGRTWDWRAAMSHFVHDLWMYYEYNAGRLDGERGWILSWLSGTYRWLSHAKLIDCNGASTSAPSLPDSLREVVQVFADELCRHEAQRPQLPLGVVWRSPIWDTSGYADDSRAMVRALALSVRPIQLQDSQWGRDRCLLSPDVDALLRALTRAQRPPSAITITQSIPVFAEPDALAASNVIRTTFETDRIPDYWHDRLAKFDEIWGFSEHNRYAFRRAGVPSERLRVVPSCIDTGLYRPDGPLLKLPAPLHGRFVFLSVFDWGYRKGWDILLLAYCQAFSPSDNTGLYLKVTRSHGHSAELIRDQIDHVLATINITLEERPDIYFTDDLLPADRMPELYRSAQAFVLPSRGEGWGRTYMEAMACGLPTIGSRATGNLDFMDDDNSFLVDGQACQIPDEAVREIPIYGGHFWFEPDQNDLQRQMRRVRENTEEREQRAQQAAKTIRERFDLAAGQQALEAAISATENRLVPPPLSARQPAQISVTIEGELFAAHSFANINQTLVQVLGQVPSIFLNFKRVAYNPTDDRAHPDAPAILRYLESRRPINAPDITIRHAYPPNWEKPRQGAWVHIQPWEYGHLPRDWIPPLRDLVDEIWVPSTYVRDVYLRSGVAADKIQVIPWGIEPTVFSPTAPPLHLPTVKSFRFLYVGGTIPRKGFDRLLKAYLAEFNAHDDVCLVVKDMGTETYYRIETMRREILGVAKDTTAPAIVYLERNFTDSQLASLYTACHSLVAPFRGEGFGMPILEALACGVVPIVPRGGPVLDFISNEAGIFLESAQEVYALADELCGPRMEWSVSIRELRAKMRWAFEHRAQLTERASAASANARQQYTWQATCAAMVKRIEHLARAPAEQNVRTSVSVLTGVGLSLVVLVHNDEATLGSVLCELQSLSVPLRVLDVGSTDRSIDIACEYGCEIIQTLDAKENTDEWLLLLTGNEFITAQTLQVLHELVRGSMNATIDVYCMRVNYGIGVQLQAENWEPRLFRAKIANDLSIDHFWPSILTARFPHAKEDGRVAIAPSAAIQVVSEPFCVSKPNSDPRTTWLHPYLAGQVCLHINPNGRNLDQLMIPGTSKLHIVETNEGAFRRSAQIAIENTVVHHRLPLTGDANSALSDNTPDASWFAEEFRFLEHLDLIVIHDLSDDVLDDLASLIETHRPRVIVDTTEVDDISLLFGHLRQWRYRGYLMRDPHITAVTSEWLSNAWLLGNPDQKVD